jgi:hypothetical protein
MNEKLILITITFLCTQVIAKGKLYAQQDSVTYTYAEVDSFDQKYDPLYRMFLADKSKETKQLWKTDLVLLSQLTPNLYYERKIGNNFSSNTGLNFMLNRTNGIMFYPDTTLYNKTYRIKFQITEGIRYYHNFKKREQLGKRTSGFSGNFIELEGKFEYTTFLYQKTEVLNYYMSNTRITLKYGLQRRIGNIGYIEPSLGIGESFNSFRFTEYFSPDKSKSYTSSFAFIKFELRLGFAINSFSDIKTIRKK